MLIVYRSMETTICSLSRACAEILTFVSLGVPHVPCVPLPLPSVSRFLRCSLALMQLRHDVTPENSRNSASAHLTADPSVEGMR